MTIEEQIAAIERRLAAVEQYLTVTGEACASCLAPYIAAQPAEKRGPAQAQVDAWRRGRGEKKTLGFDKSE